MGLNWQADLECYNQLVERYRHKPFVPSDDQAEVLARYRVAAFRFRNSVQEAVELPSQESYREYEVANEIRAGVAREAKASGIPYIAVFEIALETYDVDERKDFFENFIRFSYEFTEIELEYLRLKWGIWDRV